MLSITPHIIRPPAVLDASVGEVFSGTEGSIRQRPLQLDPVGGVRMPAPTPVAAPLAPAAAPAQPRTTTPAPGPAQLAPPAIVVPPAAAQPSGAAAAPAAMPPGQVPPPGTESYMRRLLPLMNGHRNLPASAAESGAVAASSPSESSQ